MTAAPKERTIGLVQFLVIIAVAVVVFLAWDFGHRMLDTMHLAQLDTQAGQQLSQLEEINQQLQQRKKDVSTDTFVEDYARENWKWTRPGETLFVPVATPVPPVPSAPVAAPPPPSKPWLQELLDKIFGP